MQLGLTPVIHPTAVVEKSKLGAYVEIGRFCDICESTVGDYSYCSANNEIIYTEIGKFVSIASNVRINPGQHPAFTRVTQSHFTYRRSKYGFGEDDEEFFEWRRRRRVTIGNDVWIGYNVTIMGGVTIGDGAVIGSMAVVTHDVAPYEVVVGNPAHHLKSRFPAQTIEQIRQSRWWDWSHEELAQRMEEFNDIEAFCKKYGK